MAKVFISYSSKDKALVSRLAKSLQDLRHNVWLDEWKIRVGDSIVSKISSGLENADFVAVVLSKNSTASAWVEQEWQTKYWDEVNKRKILVLPILLDDCEIPTLLKTKKYADFRVNYESGLVELSLSLQHRYDKSGIESYHSDFVGFTDIWSDLFNHTSHLDLLMMYSATWRNTYLNQMVDFLSRPGGRLRIVLPALEKDTSLLKTYAKRLQIPQKDLKERIVTAQEEYGKLSTYGKVEIYSTTKYLNHACYLFDTGGVIAFYSYRLGRLPTPALVVRDGELLTFVREDFEWLVSDKNPDREVLLS